MQPSGRLTPEIARQRLAEAQQGLALDEFEAIDDDAATVVAIYQGDLSLNGLTEWSDKAAEALAAHKGVLSLNGLTSLSDRAAQALGRHDGMIGLDRLETASHEAWDSLVGVLELKFDAPLPATVDSGEKTIGNGPNLTLEVANSLFRDDRVGDIGIFADLTFHSIDDDAAEVLATFKGDLILDDLTTLSDRAAEALARHVGQLHLDGLATLSEKAAIALIRHQGVVDVKLERLSVISPQVAEAFTKHRDEWRQRAIADFLYHLAVEGTVEGMIEEVNYKLAKLDSLEAAETLAKCECDLYLDHLTTLSAPIADVLAGHVGVLSLDRLTTLSDKAAKALGRHEGHVSLDGLTTLSEEAARWLGEHLPESFDPRSEPDDENEDGDA